MQSTYTMLVVPIRDSGNIRFGPKLKFTSSITILSVIITDTFPDLVYVCAHLRNAFSEMKGYTGNTMLL